MSASVDSKHAKLHKLIRKTTTKKRYAKDLLRLTVLGNTQKVLLDMLMNSTLVTKSSSSFDRSLNELPIASMAKCASDVKVNCVDPLTTDLDSFFDSMKSCKK